MTDQMTREPVALDPREARAEAKAAKARAKALRPWYLKKRWWAVIALVAIIGLSVASGSSSKTKTSSSNGTSGTPAAGAPAAAVAKAPAAPQTHSANTDNPPTADVALGECTADNVLDLPKATGTITNHSSKASNYIFQVEFLDGSGTRIASGYVAENNVAPGQTANWDTYGDHSGTPATCRVVSVDRLAA